MLQLLGVELFPVPAVALTDSNHYNQQVESLILFKKKQNKKKLNHNIKFIKYFGIFKHVL